MSPGWVAASVRAGLLAGRRLGRDGAAALAAQPSLAAALGDLASGPYGREATAARTLAQAQRAVAATLLWHLRVLAGWVPPAGGEALRALGAWFEIANVQDRLAHLAGGPFAEPFTLGGLASAWPTLERTGSPQAVRAALAASRWGDPGGSEPAAVVAWMRAAWAARVAAAVPEAAAWARSGAVLVLARGAGPSAGAGTVLARLAGVAGAGTGAITPPELAAMLPADLRWTLAGIDSREELWQAEARWWFRVEADAARLAAARRQDLGTVVGVVGLLAADAWRVRAALAAAAGGGPGREAFDAVA